MQVDTKKQIWYQNAPMHCRRLAERLTKHTKMMAYYSTKKIANYRDG